jgi:uncharacterized protein YceH (UPF0502 family)
MFPPDDVEIRVLGCLVEKQKTTPDQYPLTLNALRLACNQATNREPVVDYDEATIRAALGELGRRGWIRSGTGQGSRAAKYRHLVDAELELADDELAVLAVLMLRGPQTPGQIKQRTERMHPFADLDEVMLTIEGLIERDLVERLPRQPGQKEERLQQLVGGGPSPGDQEPGSVEPSPPGVAVEETVQETVVTDGLEGRVAALEAQLEMLKAELESLRAGSTEEELAEDSRT